MIYSTVLRELVGIVGKEGMNYIRIIFPYSLLTTSKKVVTMQQEEAGYSAGHSSDTAHMSYSHYFLHNLMDMGSLLRNVSGTILR